MFHPSFERFATLLRSAEQLPAATGVPPMPAALAPDPHVGPAKTRNADRRRQSGEEGVATLVPNRARHTAGRRVMGAVPAAASDESQEKGGEEGETEADVPLEPQVVFRDAGGGGPSWVHGGPRIPSRCVSAP